jgi:DHA1 family bicyclomycin/chloramphenicol resistance-like MFS transporter
VFAPTFELLLAARALQGVGAAATRVIAVAVVRDLTEGRRMAQVMSMATTVFMIVPIIAPGIGQLLLFVAPWRWIFAALLIYAVIVAAWTFVRLPETLAPENRRAFAPGAITSGYAMVLRDRLMLGYMAASTFLTACLFGYITCSEQIFGEVFDLGAAFPLAFAAIAIAISIGTFSNSRIVMRFGMRRISTAAMLWFCAVALIHTLMAWAFGDSFCQFMALMALGFLVFGLMTSNFSALAMTNMGHIAGSASALFGAVTATFGAILGALIARAFDGTTTPFLIGLTIAALGIITSVFWTERGKLSLSAGR